MDIELIEKELELAIREMNEKWDAKQCIFHLEAALDKHDNKKIGYYMLLVDLLNELTFTTKNGFQTIKLRKQYVELFNYVSQRFAAIQRFPFDSNNEEEAKMMNEVCSGIYNRMFYFIEVFSKSQESIAYAGMIPYLIARNKLKKEFRDSYLSIARVSSFVLQQYNIQDETIKENIKILSNAKL